MIEIYVTVGKRIRVKRLVALGPQDPSFHIQVCYMIEGWITEGAKWSINASRAEEYEKVMWYHAEAMVLTEYYNEHGCFPKNYGLAPTP